MQPSTQKQAHLGSTPPPPEARAWLQTIGRRGAAVHSLNQEARQLGVAVRRVKRELVKKGYAPAVALQRARAHLHLGSRP